MTTTPTSTPAKPAGQGPAWRATVGQVARKPRRAGSWAAAILFVVIVVIALVAVYQRQDDRVEVLVVTRPVPIGQVITRADVRSIQEAGVPGALRASDAGSVVGKRAAAGLVKGQVLTSAAVADALIPGDGQRLVALQLKKGRVPGGLTAGDVVEVLGAPADGSAGTKQQLSSPAKLTTSARVQSVGQTPDGDEVVTVLVDASVADQIAANSAAGQVTIVQAPATSAAGATNSPAAPSAAPSSSGAE